VGNVGYTSPYWDSVHRNDCRNLIIIFFLTKDVQVTIVAFINSITPVYHTLIQHHNQSDTKRTRTLDLLVISHSYAESAITLLTARSIH
jgi:hypothetical protein